jgi:hypothetical protein
MMDVMAAARVALNLGSAVMAAVAALTESTIRERAISPEFLPKCTNFPVSSDNV